MKLAYVIVYVTSVQKTIAFYEKAFGLKTHFVHETNTYAEMETGETTLAFVEETMLSQSIPYRFNRPDDRAAGIEISLMTDNVEQAYEKALKAGAVSVLKPKRESWNQTLAYVRDNNGCIVVICSPVEN